MIYAFQHDNPTYMKYTLPMDHQSESIISCKFKYIPLYNRLEPRDLPWIPPACIRYDWYANHQVVARTRASDTIQGTR